ncbi:cornifelin homolog B-like [Dunckerocampus dactyliophorus]|uniref:cornifelin homolog B-like n=1 Tax=Dunckerocampus dactyliophorus TaxID=161453 RepID=UPI002405B97F|nr:cornifelin homolog B-like [Dunckerocampus dactyliophorus]XP_054656278.1 cornifelin homolog B-like [Dunckerocampus dactyliophorus]XP_054656279.1 cornifelin homolog B-like [Dunckerocampus dactyliophorus]
MPRHVIRVQPQSRCLQGTEQWSTGLCACHEEMGDCCFALCCLPVFTCKVSSKAGACPLLPLLDCIGCVPPASLAIRASVRERYGIQGSVWSDCLYGCCCYSLSWMQISRELKRRAAAHTSSSSSSSSSLSSSAAKYIRLPPLQGSHLV